MKSLKDILVCILLLACSALFLSLIVLIRDADTTVKAVPAEITATRSALTAEIQATRSDLLATVNTQATAIRKTADSRLGSIQQMVDAGHHASPTDSRFPLVRGRQPNRRLQAGPAPCPRKGGDPY